MNDDYWMHTHTRTHTGRMFFCFSVGLKPHYRLSPAKYCTITHQDGLLFTKIFSRPKRLNVAAPVQ